MVHQGALGDLMLALPVLDGLAQLIPNVCLDFWGRPHLLALLAAKPYLGRIRSCEGSELAPFLLDDGWQQALVPAFFREADGLLIFGQERSRGMAERLRQRLTCQVLWIRSFPDPAQRISVGESLVYQMRAAGWPIDPGPPRLNPLDGEIQVVTDWFQKEGWGRDRIPVMLHPGSGGRHKIWPLQRWWHLIQWLMGDCGVPVLLSLGPADEVVLPLAASAERAGAHLISDVSLPRLAALISRCRLFVGNDSGVTHLAAALGVPTIAIFGPTSPDVWAPRGKNVQVIQSGWNDSEAFAFDPETSTLALRGQVRASVEQAHNR
jgi:heptosyltransferase-3